LTSALMVDPTQGFHNLSLSSVLLSALQRAKYHQPTPIQAAVIPAALSGRDILGQAQTGTGKTAAFLLPFLNSWRDTNEPGPTALVMAPTRELVAQVAEEANKLAPSKHFKVLPIYGGQRMRGQLIGLKKGCALVVGTPGRILDHLARGTLSLHNVRYLVLDEADRMLDIGFRPYIERILRRCPTDRQTLLLSATLPDPVLRLAKRYMVDPIHINLSPVNVAVENIRQCFITVDEKNKFDLLLQVIEREQPRQCIIFCQRKRWADDLYDDLKHQHKKVAVIHGDLPQPKRERIMQKFRDGSITFLVATDVVGRGIDVMGISHIINYDLPEDPENYVHRIGRTGRMGKNGVAIAFATPEQGGLLTSIEMYMNKVIPEDRIAGFEAFKPRQREAPKHGTNGAIPGSTPQPPKPVVPVFGRKIKKYSWRV
jgi:ATP-dependent RNA helicase DeaD